MYIKELKIPLNKEPRLKEEIERLVQDMNIGQLVEIDLQYDYRTEDPPLSKTVHIFYIIKEALSNVLRHANATKVTVTVRGDDKQLFVDVIDNGKGIEGESISVGRGDDVPFKQGIRNMEFRAKSIGGSLFIESTKNQGTRVSFQIIENKKGKGRKHGTEN